MIYMRQRVNKKKGEGQQLVKRLILDQIKQKIMQGSHQPLKNVKEDNNRAKVDNIYPQKKDKPKLLYQIASKRDRFESVDKLESERICESMVVDEGQDTIGSDFFEKIRNTLVIHQCFDIKIVNEMDAQQQIDKWIKMVETCKNEMSEYKGHIAHLQVKNQQLLGLLMDMQKSRKNEMSYLTNRKECGKSSVTEHLTSFCQTEEQELTPIQKLQQQKSPIGEFDRINQSGQFEGEQFWKGEITSRQNKIKNLEIQKEYLSDQVISLEKDMEELQDVYQGVSEEKGRALGQVRMLGVKCERLQRQSEVAQVELSVATEQIELQRERLRQLQQRGKGDDYRGSSQGGRSRYVELPQTGENVTVQILLKFLKRKELTKYHQALMQLISRYQTKVSALNQSYKNERQMRDRLLKYSKRIYGLISNSSLTLQQLIEAIGKYQDEIRLLRQDQIDVLLRKIKSFSIGVDSSQFQNIRLELEEYSYQLQARLPTLSEEYFQDGSSVADSYNTSAQRFQY